MKRLVRVWAVAALAVSGTVFGYGYSGMMGGSGMGAGQGMMGGSFIRHQYVMRYGIDPHYAYKSNPLTLNKTNLQAGEKLYQQNCVACHGTRGLGDGVAAKSLNPAPANIAATVRMPMATDGYLDWTISAGGKPLGTAMPAFKDSLSQKQIWQIILYIRGF